MIICNDWIRFNYEKSTGLAIFVIYTENKTYSECCRLLIYTANNLDYVASS